MEGFFFFSSKDLTQGHWTDAAGGQCDFHGLAEYAHVYGDDNDEWRQKKKKQLKGEREKRESICRAHDTMLAALDDVFIKKFEGEVVGAVAFCLIHHIESVIDI